MIFKKITSSENVIEKKIIKTENQAALIANERTKENMLVLCYPYSVT